MVEIEVWSRKVALFEFSYCLEKIKSEMASQKNIFVARVLERQEGSKQAKQTNPVISWRHP